MRGRAQAVLVAAISTATVFLAWLGAAVVALVMLRKGVRAGSDVLLWTALPALMVAVLLQDTGPLAVLLIAAALAAALRHTRSWPMVLTLATGAGGLLAAVLLLAAPAYLDQLAELLRQVVQEAVRGRPEAGSVTAPGSIAVAGMLGLSAAATAVLCLLLARWWQAQLYNPGGFRQEFHQLRLPPALAVTLLSVGVALFWTGPQWRIWTMIAGMPLAFAGFALIHGLVGQRQLGTGWLVAAYGLWLIADWAKALLLLSAVADSWMDFRGRGPRAGTKS